MNSPNFKTARFFTKFFLFLFCSFAHIEVKAFDVDFSRRTKEIKRSFRGPANVNDNSETTTDSSTTESFFQSVDPSQDIVIALTENGFIPSKFSVRKNQRYNLHIVNLNPQQKNASFILDAFSEHHGIYFSNLVKIEIRPKVEGPFSFESPEVGKKGLLIVLPESASAGGKGE